MLWRSVNNYLRSKPNLSSRWWPSVPKQTCFTSHYLILLDYCIMRRFPVQLSTLRELFGTNSHLNFILICLYDLLLPFFETNLIKLLFNYWLTKNVSKQTYNPETWLTTSRVTIQIIDKAHGKYIKSF